MYKYVQKYKLFFIITYLSFITSLFLSCPSKNNTTEISPIDFELELFPDSPTISGLIRVEAKIEPETVNQLRRLSALFKLKRRGENGIVRVWNIYYSARPPFKVEFDTSYLENGTYTVEVELRSYDRVGVKRKTFEIKNCFSDRDKDGYGSDIDFIACDVRRGGDCDDENPSINPGEYELPDGIDQNCNGLIDEGTIIFSGSVSGCLSDMTFYGENIIVATYFPMEIFKGEVGNPAIYFFNKENGKQVKILRTESGVYSKLKIYYIDSTPYILIPTISGKLFSFSLTSFEQIWMVDIVDRIFVEPVIYDVNADGSDDIIIAGFSGKIFAVDGKTGKTLWQYFVGENIISFYSFGRYIILISAKGEMHILESNGSVEKIVNFGNIGPPLWFVYPQPVVFGSYVIIPMPDGYVYALDKDSFPDINVAWKFKLCEDIITCYPTSLTVFGENLIISFTDFSEYFYPEFAELTGERVQKDSPQYVSRIYLINTQGTNVGELSFMSRTIFHVSQYDKILVTGLAIGVEKNLVDFFIGGRLDITSKLEGELRFFDLAARKEIFRKNFGGAILYPIYILHDEEYDVALFSTCGINFGYFTSNIFGMLINRR